MFKRIFILTSLIFIFGTQSYGQFSDFLAPDSVCVNQNIELQNTSVGGSSYYWNFCSGNLANNPVGFNMGNIGNLNKPVYSIIAKDGDSYFVFIANNGDGSITRLAFGNSLNNAPVVTNLGDLGMLGYYVEGIEIKKDNLSGKWIGLISWGQIDQLIRLDFGNSLNNVPTAENLGNINGLMSFAHTIYTFTEGGKWYSFIGNYATNSIIKLNFGNSLTNFPTAINLGNIGQLNGPVGFYPIQESGSWYMFVVNRNSNSLSRLDFGSSLDNLPTGINLGTINNSLREPRSITFVRDCGNVYGFVVNETTNDIVRLTFPNGLLNSPSGITLGNVASFSFPHHISELFRIGDDLFAFVLNVNSNSISRIKFTGCTNSTIPSSNVKNPPLFYYQSPGIYTIRLVLNEGQPTQSVSCKEIVVINPPQAQFSCDTSVCVGGILHLNATAYPGSSYNWIGPNNFSSTGQNPFIIDASYLNDGIYTLKISNSVCSIPPVEKRVRIYQDTYKPDINGDSVFCAGESVRFSTSGNSVSEFHWQGPNGFESTKQNVTIEDVETVHSGIYSLKVNRNGCTSISEEINVLVRNLPEVYLGPDTVVCAEHTLVLDAGNNGTKYNWSTGDTSQLLQIFNPGKYSVTVSDGKCTSQDEIYVDACNSALWLPNVFTPNDDGINEKFKPVILGIISSFRMVIFNRWGQQLYETTDIISGWNGDFMGEPCPSGVYYYIIEYSSGLTPTTIQQNTKRGAVTLLR